MKFSFAFLSIAVMVVPALAVPAPDAAAEAAPALEIEKRDNSIYVCTGQDWDGDCVPFDPTWNECTPFSALGLSGLGSWGPSSGTFCILYNEPCGSSDVTASNTFTDPGLAPVPGFWVFNTQSFKCWW